MKRRRRKDAEDEEREELARERRERARRARGGLGAKVAGESGGDSGESESGTTAGSKPEAEEKSEPEAKSKSRSKAKAESKAEPTLAERRAQRERLRASKAAADKRKEAEDDEKPKSAKRAKDAKGETGEKPKAGRKPKDDDGKRSGRSPGRGLRRRGAEEPVAATKGAKPAAGKRGDKAEKATAAMTSSRPARKRGAAAKRTGAGALTALKQGAGETRTRIRKAAPKAANGAAKLLAWAFGIFFIGFGFVLRLLIAAYRFAYGPVRTALLMARRALQAVSRQVTPVRALALVVAGAAVLLALSQFAVYRTVTIGNDAYAPGITTVAPPPVAETADTGSAHSYLMVPLAVVSLIVLGAALTGRWRLCRLIALAGLVAIAVSLIHDRPTGLDPGSEAVAYTGVKATLVGGFYAQIFSGLLLTLSSLLLGRELKLAGSRRPAHASRGSRSRRKLLRRNPRVEGARA